MLEKEDKIGDYTLIKFLGRGQFGEVWLAEKQLQFSTRKFRHALKFLSNRSEEIDLKAAEAEIDTWIEASGHPNVMPVLDMIVFKDYIIIISEYADGGSLYDWLKQNNGKSPTVEKALEMMIGILRGIEHLHSRNVVHRDLKPDNILLQGNFPRITDFGISRIVSENTTATKPFGSPMFMSLEAFEGKKSPQTDLWSAGVIFYKFLSGQYPFTGIKGEGIITLVNQIRNDNPMPLPEDIPEDIKSIIAKALQKDSAQRFQTAREMRLAIEKSLYKLRIKATSDDVVSDYSHQIIQSQPIINFTDEFNSLSDETEVEQPNLETLRMTVQPEIEIVQETQPSPIDETKDAEELQREKQEQRESEIAEINQLVGGNRQKQQTKQRKKNFLIAGGVGGSILILSLAALYIGLTNSNSIQGNTNSVRTNSADVSISQSTKENTTNTESKETKPIPPQGMVYVPGGEFMMGRDDGKLEEEKPAHKVSVNPFFMDIYETTNEQYAEFVKATNRQPPGEWKSGVYPNGQAKFPVVGVNWEDADAFCKNAGKRLPSEEEWEFAARGANNFLYPWGNDWKPGQANVGSQTFAEIGKFKGASPFGIYDLVGNAGEWTGSDFKAYPNGKLSDVFAGKTNLKTIRGGSFDTLKDFATATYRIGWLATGADTYNRTGFRCVQDVEK